VVLIEDAARLDDVDGRFTALGAAFGPKIYADFIQPKND